jgi:hypothetical protein
VDIPVRALTAGDVESLWGNDRVRIVIKRNAARGFDLVRDAPKGHQMTRQIALRIADLLIGHATSERYPTRSVEYMLAWMLIGWSFMVALPGDILRGTDLRLHEIDCAGMGLGNYRIVTGFLAVVRADPQWRWKKSPYLRLAGAVLGFNFWLILDRALWRGSHGGAPLFQCSVACRCLCSSKHIPVSGAAKMRAVCDGIRSCCP